MTNKGEIEVICGSMFCGKTDELLRRLGRLPYSKKSNGYLLFKHKIDNRYDKDHVSAHNGSKLPAINIQDPEEVFDYIDMNSLPTAIGFDEAQFLTMNIVGVVDRLSKMGIRVILAGLDNDFRYEPFGPMPYLLAKATRVTKLTAYCAVCGEDKATRTQRLVNGKPARYTDPIIMVGASESYEARCAKCHEVIYEESEETSVASS